MDEQNGERSKKTGFGAYRSVYAEPVELGTVIYFAARRVIF